MNLSDLVRDAIERQIVFKLWDVAKDRQNSNLDKLRTLAGKLDE